MTAHVHRVDGGEHTAGPAVRAHPLQQAQLFGRNMRREQRVCARSGSTLHLWQTPAADGGRNSKNNNRRQQAREPPPTDGGILLLTTPALVRAQTSRHRLDLFTWKPTQFCSWWFRLNQIWLQIFQGTRVFCLRLLHCKQKVSAKSLNL